MIAIKEHQTPDGKLMLAACDERLVDTSHHEGEFKIDCPASFFKERIIQTHDFTQLLSKTVNANLVGEEAVGAAKSQGFIETTSIKRIADIPYAYMVRFQEE